MHVSRGGYYQWQNRSESNREVENNSILREILRIHREFKETYGSPRMTVELNNRGVACCENTVAKLMQEHGIRAKMDRRYKPRQWKPGSVIKKGNLLENYDGPTRPHEIWVADFTYVKIRNVFMYFSTVMDLYTRKIVGIEISKRRNADMVLNTIKKALASHPDQCPDIFHSDRGIEYANYVIGNQLSVHGIKQSMSGKGNCYDNAHMESFFHTYKSELYYTEPFRNYLEFKRKTKQYVRFYNERRLHSSLGYRSPVDFEKVALASVNF